MVFSLPWPSQILSVIKQKQKTSEAKLQLSAVYSALTSLQSDYDAFATCLTDAGYVAPTANNYYAIGMAKDNSKSRDIVIKNGGTCTSNFQFPANKSVGGYTAQAIDLDKVKTAKNYSGTGADKPSVDDAGAYFVAGAIGGIDPDHNSSSNGLSVGDQSR